MDADTSDDDVSSIDWSETAYDLPEPHLFTEQFFNQHVRPSYAKYLNIIQKAYSDSPTKKNTCQSQSGESSIDNIHKKALQSQSEECSLLENTLKKKAMQSQSEENTAESTHKKPLEQQQPLHNKIFESDEGNQISIGHVPETSKQIGTRICTDYHLLFEEHRKSCIRSGEKRFYLKGFGKDKVGGQLTRVYRKMQIIHEKIHREQIEFQKFLNKAALTNMNRYLHVNDKVKECVVKHIHDSVTELLQQKRQFMMIRQINLQQLVPTPTIPFLTYIRRVYEQGSVPRYSLPPIGTKLELDSSLFTFMKNNRISDDTISTMCQSEPADIYINAAALIAIMEGLAVDTREWMLSLEVKNMAKGVGSKRKIVTVLPPLPRRIMSTREFNTSYYQSIIRKLVKSVNTRKSRNTRDSSSEDECEEDLVIDMEENAQVEDDQQVNTNEPNIHVNLFSLGDLNLLVETTVDQYDPVTQKTFQISPKCEYQHAVGFEQFSLLEICNAFWESHLTNSDWIVCPRVDIWNEDIVRNDTYTREVLCPIACPYNPRHYCNHLYYILQELRSLDHGKYTIERSVRDHHINIYQQTESGLTYNNILYKDVQQTEFIVDIVSPWLPVDTAIYTETMIQEQWIPCLFSQHQTFDETQQGNKKKNEGNMGKIGSEGNKWKTGNQGNREKKTGKRKRQYNKKAKKVAAKYDLNNTPTITPNINSSRKVTSYTDEEF